MIDDSANIGYACTARHVAFDAGEKVALRWIDASLTGRSYTFTELNRESNLCANLFANLGFRSGDTLFTFLPKLPEQFFAFLGALKLQLLTGTLFSNFGDDALIDRLGDAAAKGIVTKKSLLKKIKRIRPAIPSLQTIIVVDVDEHEGNGIYSYRLLRETADDFLYGITDPSTPSVLHYTSGSTGKPKGVVHTHASIDSQITTGREVLMLGENDIYWCTADQGWVTGTSYGIIAPWALGVTQIHYGGGYDAEAWFSILEGEKVTVWYTAPTALRMLMREDSSLFARFDLSSLRHICSVGEPLNPEVIRWGKDVLGKNIYDTWFQTETGAIMIANHEGVELRPGSMGHPVAGVEAVILDDAGNPLPDGEQGHLCLRAGWPSMFRTYLNNPEGYSSKFHNGWYYSGDTAWRDCDGYFWFKGRSDDVINTAGHLVSPFEVESALLEISEIAESGVIGAPDELLFEKLVAYVHLHNHTCYSTELELKIRLHIANRVSSIATPQEIVVVESIPKNKSGKIMRRVLKARYLGIDPGDTSTLEI